MSTATPNILLSLSAESRANNSASETSIKVKADNVWHDIFAAVSLWRTLKLDASATISEGIRMKEEISSVFIIHCRLFEIDMISNERRNIIIVLFFEIFFNIDY
jgi:hypothetical protein